MGLSASLRRDPVVVVALPPVEHTFLTKDSSSHSQDSDGGRPIIEEIYSSDEAKCLNALM
jgi:hypothetical protein